MPENTDSTTCPFLTAGELSAVTVGEKTVLLDVRSPIEFEAESIPGSVNLPLGELESRFEEVPRAAELVIICRSGKRAERAAYTLMSKGFHPRVLQGGLLSWQKAGLPVKEGRKRLSIERQIQLVVGISVLSGISLGVSVNQWFLAIPAFFGAGLTFAGLTGFCGLGLLLAKAPWNKLAFDVKRPLIQCKSETAQDRHSCCS